jgi:hypothetical protein
VTASSRPLVLACGALAGDLRAVLRAGGFEAFVDVEYLPAHLHNRPDAITPRLRPLLQAAGDAHRPVFIAYADCGTGGALDALLGEFPGVRRLPGAHCYEVFAGETQFQALQDEELGTFYLTDFLTKHFDALVWQGLGLDRHPELRDTYFRAYRRVVLLSQAPDAALVERARVVAARLDLDFVHRSAGRDGIRVPLLAFADHQQAHGAAAR